MKKWWAFAGAILFGFLIAGLLFLLAGQPRGQPIPLVPAPSPMPLTVYLSGAISQPGLYTLPASSRISDAVQAAGGLLPEADTASLNLAAPLRDGQHIRVPFLPSKTSPQGDGNTQPDAESTILAPININSANQAELDSLPEIGPALANAIIQYRDEHGPFETIEDIQKVPGIGPATFEMIKNLITVD